MTRTAALLEDVRRHWQRDPSGIYRRRRDDGTATIFAAGRFWRVTRAGEAVELRPGRVSATWLLLSVLDRESDDVGTYRLYQLVQRRRRERRRGRPRYHAPSPRRLQRMSRESERKLLTVRDVAERLNVSPETVRKWARSGMISAVKIGPEGSTKPRIRFTEDDAARLSR